MGNFSSQGAREAAALAAIAAFNASSDQHHGMLARLDLESLHLGSTARKDFDHAMALIGIFSVCRIREPFYHRTLSHGCYCCQGL